MIASSMKPAPDLKSAPIGMLAPPRLTPLPLGRVIGAPLSGMLLFLCYFPVAWGWLSWIALVPLLTLVRSEARSRNVYFASWLGGMVFFVTALHWMSAAGTAMAFAGFALATYCALYFPLGVFLMRRLDRHTPLPLVLTVPIVWTGLEYLRSFLLTGFAWYFLAHAQHNVLPLIQMSDLTGAYGVSLLVAAANAWLFEALCQTTWFRRLFDLPQSNAAAWPRLALQASVLCVVLVAAVGYGVWRLEEPAYRAGPRVALLQGNLDQRLRNRGDMSWQEVAKHYVELSKLAVNQHESPHLIVWPETSYPLSWMDWSPRLALSQVPQPYQDRRDELTQYAFPFMVQGCRAFHLLGVNVRYLDDDGNERRYNRAMLIDPWGRPGEFYDKFHRVPFGEYVPFQDWLPFMRIFSPYKDDYSLSIGDKMTRFTLGPFKFGVLTCFEDTDPVLARHYHRDEPDGPPVDFLINISNDGWFDDSSEHEQHLAISRFRAIETRRSLVRAVNMGISAVIDSNGRVLEPTVLESKGGAKSWAVMGRDYDAPSLSVGRWSEFKQVHGVLSAQVPIDGRDSLYARWGDWLPIGCWLVVGGGWLLGGSSPSPRRARWPVP